MPVLLQHDPLPTFSLRDTKRLLAKGDMILRDCLLAFISEQDLKLNGELTENTSLVRSGLFNSLALFNLAQWVEEPLL